ncbi:hypothetical protein IHN63_00755 [Deinococcus sp. 6YEL10]|uniref:hypothetical protein n=1 Tax=Deinococcus sp. 6YEL10 TaxID=2745870 RepID=UPI001E5B9F81|nr:hypothetical protein [Deinococcus sp. 6YEL10]MCD0159827.1 hypothetical protein [Deinococcus sp. 6YEL10]
MFNIPRQPYHRTDANGVTHYYPGTETRYSPIWPVYAVNPDGTAYSLYDDTPARNDVISRAARRTASN